MRLDISEIARSIELYNLGVRLQQERKEGHIVLELVREPLMRKRKEVGKLVVAFGSYDPLSIGHETLFQKGLEVARSHKCRRGSEALDELVIISSTLHFEKQIDLRKNSAIYDRVHAQEGFASCLGNVSLAFFNDPLFVNLVPALEDKYGKKTDLYLLIGADVMEKILDRDGYVRFTGRDCMEEVVDKLFEHCFIIADRNVKYKDGRAKRYLNREILVEENPILQQYAERIIGIDLQDNHPKLEIDVRDVSSTMIRNERSEENGDKARKLEAVGISDFVDKRSLYIQDSDRYEAFACARQMFADFYREKGAAIGDYIHSLMKHLEKMNKSVKLRKRTIDSYHSGSNEIMEAYSR